MNFDFLAQYDNPIIISLVTASVVLIVTLILLGELAKSLGKNLYPKHFIKPVKVKEPKASKLLKLLTKTVEIEQEHTIMMDHEYDGIRELDNDLPPWWKYGFYFTIFWGICYFTFYTVTEIGPSSAEELKIAQKEAQIQIDEYNRLQASNITPANVTILTNPADLSKGESMFISKCAPCHGNEAQGISGPNLTDNYWLHGGSIGDVFSTITYGVPSKGMIAWGEKLESKKIQQLASYIISLEGSNPANAKPQEGELYDRNAEAAASEDVEATEATDSEAVEENGTEEL